MSGLEVAGLVLRVFPILYEGFKEVGGVLQDCKVCTWLLRPAPHFIEEIFIYLTCQKVLVDFQNRIPKLSCNSG
jgi:hypothetical protein